MPNGQSLRAPDAKLSPFARDIERFVEANHFPYISATPMTVAQLTGDLAARYPWRKAIVSDGASNKYEAISNGTAFYYLDGSAV